MFSLKNKFISEQKLFLQNKKRLKKFKKSLYRKFAELRIFIFGKNLLIFKEYIFFCK
jgi:hypothetical protein